MLELLTEGEKLWGKKTVKNSMLNALTWRDAEVQVFYEHAVTERLCQALCISHHATQTGADGDGDVVKLQEGTQQWRDVHNFETDAHSHVCKHWCLVFTS